jgi:hypothetical protein
VAPSRPILVGEPLSRIRLPLDALKPFLADPERAITFSDLQAAFGLDLYMMRKAVRVLRFAQLLDRRTAGRDPTPRYFLPKATVTLLTPTAAYKLTREKAVGYFNVALEVASSHNAAHVHSRVTALAVKGTLLDPSVELHEFVQVEVTVAVRPVDTLVQDIDHLVRSLRRIGDRALRISLIICFG